MVKRQPENLDQPQLPLEVGVGAPLIDPVKAIIAKVASLTGQSERALSAPGGLDHALLTLKLGKQLCANCVETNCPGCGS